MKPIVVIGAGGHARVVVDALNAELAAGGRYQPVAVVDVFGSDASDVLGVPVIGCDYDLSRMRGEGTVLAAAVGIGFVNNASVRRRAHAKALAAELELPPVVHPAATVSPDARLSAGCFVAAGAVVGPLALIGEGAIVNTNAVVDHDCRVGDFAHIAPGAALSGGVSVGECSLVGTGAATVQGVCIGANVIVGSGAVVIADVATRCS